jgi:Nif-specific regulatory protein
MGRVFLVSDLLRSDRELALKTLRKGFFSSAAAERLKEEFRAMTRLAHPNLARVYDFGFLEDSGEPFLTLEYLDGKDLSRFHPSEIRGFLPDLIAQLARALDYIHARGVLHRDLKPQNILMLPRPSAEGTGEYLVKLMDFGLARLADQTDQAGAAGTLAYSAPEVFRGERVDERADLYSLGVVLFRAATGSVPFPAKDAASLLAAHRDTAPPRPRELEPTIPEGIERILLWLLEKRPEDRPRSAAALLGALNEALGTRHELETRETRESHLTGGTLVGRDAEMAVLRSALDRISGRAGKEAGAPARVIFLEGESGSGKTRILRELRYQAQTLGCRFLLGHCYDSGRVVYRPLLEAFHDLLPLARAGEGAGARLAPALGPFLPELLPAGEREAAPVEGDARAKRRLFEAALQLLFEAAGSSGLVLALEDLHWADEPTLEFLDFARDRIGGHPILLVATFRGEEAGDSPLAALLPAAGQAGVSLRLRLGRLEPEQIGDLVRSMVDLEEGADELALLLHRQTAGNPLFLEEVLKGLAEEAALERREGRWRLNPARLERVEIPRTVQETLQRRVGRVSAAERRLLRILSVFERPVDPALLARAGGWREEEIAPLLSDLAERGLLARRRGDGLSFAGFAHARTREIVYRGLGADRARLHRTAGELLEETATSREQVVEELAHHFLAAGAKEKALEYAEQAGDKCARLFAYPAALRFYQTGLPLVPRKETARRLDLLAKTAGSLTRTARYTEMQDVLQRALRLARSLKDRPREGRLLASLAHGHLLQGHFEPAIRNARAALALCEPAGDSLGAGRAQNFIATAYAQMGRMEEAIPWFARALERLEESGDLRQAGWVRNNLGNVHLGRYELEEALRLFRLALDTWQKLGDRPSSAITLTNIAQALKDLGKPDEAAATVEEALPLYRESFDRSRLAVALVSAAEIHLARGACDRALACATESAQIRREIGETAQLPHSLDAAGAIRRAIGDLDTALELHREGLRRAREERCEIQEGFLLASLALDQAERGDRDEARSTAEQALVLGKRLRIPKIEALALSVLVRQALERDERKEAAARLRDLETLAAAEPNPELRIRSTLAGAWLRLREGALDDAEATFQSAVETAERLGRADLAAEARLGIARTARQAGRLHRARDCAHGAREAFRGLAARMEDSALRRRYLASGTRRAAEALLAELEESAPPESESPRVPPARYLATMYEITQAISTLRDLNELLNRVLDQAISIVGAERGIVFLRDAETGELKVQAARNLERETIRDAGEYSRRILEEAGRGRSLVSVDAGSDRRFEAFDSVSLYNIRSLICVPLRIRDRILGTVYVDSRSPKTIFGDEELAFLEAFANQAAIAIENAQLLTELREENTYLRRAVDSRFGFDSIVGRSPALEKVLERLARVAESNVSVVLQGESGTGKELAARALHLNSPRRDKRFVCENVAALPETLLESELFGHVRGAFTGADRDRAGLFEQADGGTLFLDEVGEMSLSLQSKLLRVLEDGEIRPVGGSRTRKVDVRIVAATNRDLRQMVHEKRFREDLFYRLNVVTVTLPPLRQRREDVPLLVEHFLGRIARDRGARPLRVDPAVLALLARHEWPGNVRELENAVSRLSLFASGPMITLSDLARDPELLDRVSNLAGPRSSPEPELRRTDIRQALRTTRGNKVQAAALLGISRATLFRKLRQFRITD